MEGIYVVNMMDLAPLQRGPFIFLVGIVNGGKLPYGGELKCTRNDIINDVIHHQKAI